MGDAFRALVLDQNDKKVTAEFRNLTTDDLPDGDVLVRVKWSTLNYKDGMILNGLGRLVRTYPHVPGVDFPVKSGRGLNRARRNTRLSP